MYCEFDIEKYIKGLEESFNRALCIVNEVYPPRTPEGPWVLIEHYVL